MRRKPWGAYTDDLCKVLDMKIDYDPRAIRDPAKILRDAVAFAREPGRHQSIYLTLPLAEKLAEQFERLERLLGYAVTSKRTGFTVPDHWLPDAQYALRYDVPNDIELESSGPTPAE